MIHTLEKGVSLDLWCSYLSMYNTYKFRHFDPLPDIFLVDNWWILDNSTIVGRVGRVLAGHFPRIEPCQTKYPAMSEPSAGHQQKAAGHVRHISRGLHTCKKCRGHVKNNEACQKQYLGASHSVLIQFPKTTANRANLKNNSKSWKLVFRGFPYMGMFDWEGVIIPAYDYIISNSNVKYPCVYFSLLIYDHILKYEWSLG